MINREYIPHIKQCANAQLKQLDIKQANWPPFFGSPRARAMLRFHLVSGDLSKPIRHGLASNVANYDANWKGIHCGPLEEG